MKSSRLQIEGRWSRKKDHRPKQNNRVTSIAQPNKTNATGSTKNNEHEEKYNKDRKKLIKKHMAEELSVWTSNMGCLKQSNHSYLNWMVGLTMRPDLFQANAWSRPKANDLSGHCNVGVMRVPHLFYIQQQYQCSSRKRRAAFINYLDDPTRVIKFR